MGDEERERLKKQQQTDQTLAYLVDVLPVMWKTLFDNLIKTGFKEPQAMELLKAYIVGSAGGGKI